RGDYRNGRNSNPQPKPLVALARGGVNPRPDFEDIPLLAPGAGRRQFRQDAGRLHGAVLVADKGNRQRRAPLRHAEQGQPAEEVTAPGIVSATTTAHLDGEAPALEFAAGGLKERCAGHGYSQPRARHPGVMVMLSIIFVAT